MIDFSKLNLLEPDQEIKSVSKSKPRSKTKKKADKKCYDKENTYYINCLLDEIDQCRLIRERFDNKKPYDALIRKYRKLLKQRGYQK